MFANGLPITEVGDFQAFLLSLGINVKRSTVLDLITSAPIAINGCIIRIFF